MVELFFKWSTGGGADKQSRPVVTVATFSWVAYDVSIFRSIARAIMCCQRVSGGVHGFRAGPTCRLPRHVHTADLSTVHMTSAKQDLGWIHGWIRGPLFASLHLLFSLSLELSLLRKFVLPSWFMPYYLFLPSLWARRLYLNTCVRPWGFCTYTRVINACGQREFMNAN